jgi:succinate dehydrogenase / fumarate reductase iron-sulfur subunit
MLDLLAMWLIRRNRRAAPTRPGHLERTEHMKLKLRIWRQAGPSAAGTLVDYTAGDVSPDMSFLEMLDVVNEELIKKGQDAIAFDSDCREGICGMCSLVVNGVAHGPDRGTTVCQLHMRRFRDGDTITVEPWRARAFPVVKDLVVDRSAFDRIIAAGGYVSINTGGAQDGNNILIPKDVAEVAMDSAACIGCGACVAACKNASAHLFMSAKISHLSLLPQGQQERYRRVTAMIEQADSEGFGSCSNEGECEAVCPKEIPISNIARMTREYVKAQLGAGK